jgi:Protein NO VEIN, C-terminal
MFEAVREALLSEQLLPSHGGGYLSGRTALLARTNDLRELVKPDQLAQLYKVRGEDERGTEVRWRPRRAPERKDASEQRSGASADGGAPQETETDLTVSSQDGADTEETAPQKPGAIDLDRPRASREAKFISYVAVGPSDEEGDPDDLAHEERMSLEEKAIKLILAAEPHLMRTSANNPGFDLFEKRNGEITRWIEVKAMTHDLYARPVGLSRTQFECARQHGESYWLYVVERAGSSDDAWIVRIQDPAGKAQTFTFDRGWLEVAETERIPNSPITGPG